MNYRFYWQLEGISGNINAFYSTNKNNKSSHKRLDSIQLRRYNRQCKED